jgi:hypothetical protein
VAHRPTDRWNRFWFAEGNPLALGVFRALFALCLAWELPFTRANSLFAVEGGFHLPYVSFIKPISPYLFLGIHDLQWVFILMLGLGIMTRLSAGALLVLQGYVFFTDQLNFRNHPYFFLLVLLLLMFSPAGKAFSLPALFRRLRSRGVGTTGAVAPLTAQRLLQVQVSIVYFYAALHKMSGPYFSGRILTHLIAPAISVGRLGKVLALLPPRAAEALQSAVDRPGFWAFAATATVLLELSLAFVLWFPRTRKPAMILGILFHLGIAIVMSIDTFSAAMIASYLLFLDPETLPGLFARIGARLGGPSPAPVPSTPGSRPRLRPIPR